MKRFIAMVIMLIGLVSCTTENYNITEPTDEIVNDTIFVNNTDTVYIPNNISIGIVPISHIRVVDQEYLLKCEFDCPSRDSLFLIFEYDEITELNTLKQINNRGNYITILSNWIITKITF